MKIDGGSNQKVALVFGGSRGIGAAAVRRLASDGFAVAFTYVSRPDKARELAETVHANGGLAFPIAADSADADAIKAAVDAAIGRFGGLNVAVINAGILRTGTVDAFTLKDLDDVLTVNVRGVYVAIQTAVARMSDNGRVITIGSNTAVRTLTPIGTVYAMSKAAVAALVKGLALDLAPRGILVNNIQPGPIETDLTASHIDRLKASIPLKRFGQPDDVAALVSYLAGDASIYMTGSSLTLDGGMSL